MDFNQNNDGQTQNLPPMLELLRNLCAKAFDVENASERKFMSDIATIKSTLARMTIDDLNIHLGLLSEKYWSMPNKAPITYIELFEVDMFSISLYILKPGFSTLIFKQPAVYRFMKVLSSTMLVDTYKEIPCEDIMADVTAEEERDRIRAHQFMGESIEFAQCAGLDMFFKWGEPCTLSPLDGIYRSIWCPMHSGPLAFLEVISPPRVNGTFNCLQYYKNHNSEANLSKKYLPMERSDHKPSMDIVYYNCGTF